MPNARGQIRITNDIPDGNSYSDGVIEWREISMNLIKVGLIIQDKDLWKSDVERIQNQIDSH